MATALLGIRGSGKSNLARVVAEECYRSKIPVVIFDPVGNWYGIRAGRDGKPGGGLPFAIFGGPHGDVPLEAGAGQLVADTIVDTRLSCVIDMSHEDFLEADKRRFLEVFGDRLFRRKQPETGWMLLILEEVDDYAPQGARGDALKTLGVFQRLVKRGRFKGLGALLLTQRSAAVSKDLLYMVETLVAFRTTAPRDQETVADWMRHHSLGEEALSSLHELADGEAWVWSPEAMGILERQKFRRMGTLDTGRTPGHVAGKTIRPATLADIDVPALRVRMASTIARAKAEDPKELRRQLAEVRAELKSAKDRTGHPTPEAYEAVCKALEKSIAKRPEVQVLKDTQVKRLDSAIDRARDMAAVLLKRHASQVDALSQRLQVVVTEAGILQDQIKAALGAAAQDARGNLRPAVGAGRPAAQSRPAPVAPQRAARTAGPGALPPFYTAALTALAQHSAGLTKGQILIYSGYRQSGDTSAAFAAMGRDGWVRSDGRLLTVTESGLQALGPFEPLPIGKELRESLVGDRSKLSRLEKALLGVLFEAYPDAIGKGEILERRGYKQSGDTSATFAKFVALGWARKGDRGRLRAADEFFVEAGA